MVQGRWGHKAVYVESTKSVYIVGGEISGDGLQITNEVLQLDLSQDSSTPTSISSTSLNPLAFHSLTYSPTTNELITFGGLTSSCSDDSILHSYSLDTGSWRSENANGLIRRRGAGMVFNQGDGSVAAGGDQGALMVFGGIADQYSCSAITYAYPAFDILPVPLSSYPTFQTERMTINGGINGFAVSDFGMASLPNNTVLFLGGSDKDGNVVGMDKLTAWSSERDWYQLELGGDVPDARVGGGMTIHPTLSDLVIFQGGATKDGDTSTPVPTLNFLNLTTLEWYTPSNLQPPASYARAWHGSTMTSSGVIVTSFGLGSTGTPRDDVTFLDLSNPDATKWSWKSVWSSSMLTAPAGTSSGSVTGNAGLQSDNGTSSSDNNDKELKSILPPVLIVGIILLGLGMWLARRQVGIVRRRRLARHFEIDATHDEEGNRRGSTTNFPNPLSQFLAARGWRRQSSFGGMGQAGSSSAALPRPFGGIKIPEADAESVRSAAAAIKGKVAGYVGILKRWSGSQQNQGNGSREMTQTGGQGAARVQWEEIDFGLGRVDEQRRGPGQAGYPSRAPGASTQAGSGGQIPRGQFNKNRSRVSYDGDLADAKELPEVVVVPPSNPVTPMALNSDGSEMQSFPVLAPSPKIDDPETARQKARASAEWDDLAKDVQTRNPFADPEPIYANDGEENNTLPPLAFQRNSVTDFSTGLSSYGIGLGQPSRRVSTSDASVSRSVSSPHSNARASVYSNGSSPRDLMTGSPTRGQELTRSVSDRTRNLANMFTRSSVDSNIPDDANITPLRNSSRQRLSNPPLGPPPTSPLPNAPNSAFNGRRVSAGAVPGYVPADGTIVRTASGDRQLHIANPSFDAEVDEFGSSSSHGQAF